MGCGPSQPAHFEPTIIEAPPADPARGNCMNNCMVAAVPEHRPHQRHAALLPEDEEFHPSCNGRRGHEFNALYSRTEEQLDGGNFGQIFRCRHQRGSNDTYWKIGAVKVTHPNALDIQYGPINSYDDLYERCQEIRTLTLLQRAPTSKHILRLQEYFYNKNTRELKVVTELLQMNLKDWIEEQEQFTERQGRSVARVLLGAINFMHNRGILHRDIKEANVVFQRTGDLGTLKVVDFGLAKELQPGQKERAFCGSLGYIAPEIYMKEPYSFQVDLFSFGVLMFKILSGKRPWPPAPADETGRRTVNLEYRIVNDQWKGVSRNGRDFIRQLLVFAEERLTADQALHHGWLSELTATVLRVGASRGNSLNQSPSDAVINPEGATHTQDSRENTRFWIEDNVQDALLTFVQFQAFHGKVVSNKNGHALIEEMIPQGANLLPYYIKDQLDVYTERECRSLCREIAICIKQFHDGNVVHRKLHMENVVVESHLGNANFNVSLRGVQYAQMIRDDQPLTGRVGRLNQMKSWHAFVAPEIESEFYHDKRVDLWSLGSIIYMCLCGTAPVRPDLYFEIVTPSDNAQNLVRSLLQRNPSQRLTIEEVLQHPWMMERDEVLAKEDLGLAKDIWAFYSRAGRKHASGTEKCDPSLL